MFTGTVSCTMMRNSFQKGQCNYAFTAASNMELCRHPEPTSFSPASYPFFMICQSKSAINPAPQDVIKTTRWNNIQDADGVHTM
jgi:hypothetical protein